MQKKLNFSFFSWLIVVIIITYIYINNPLFSILNGIGSIKLLYPFVFLAFFLNGEKVRHFIHLYKKETVIFFLIFLYVLLRSALGGDLAYLKSVVVAFVESLLMAYFIVDICLNRIRSVHLETIIIYVGLIASIITIYCISNPQFNYYVRTELIKFPERLMALDFRGFGISESLTYSYGITQGIALSLCFVKLSKHKLYLIFIPFLVISILFNARIGFVPPIIMLFYLIFIEKEYKSVLLVGIVVALLFIIASGSIFIIEHEKTISWGLDFFKQVSDYFVGNENMKSSTINVLLSDMKVLPATTSEWLIGSGTSFYLNVGHSTDVGYFLQLTYGGIIYVTLLLSLVMKMSFRIFIYKEYRWFLCLFMLTTLICNIKGDFVPGSAGFRLLMLIYVYMINSNYPTGKNNIKI
jgi:hypothetical protein